MPTNNTGLEVPGVTNYLSAMPLSAHRLMVVLPNGTVAYASNDNLEHLWCIVGISLNSTSKSGERVSVQRAGRIREVSWNWQPSRIIWLGVDGFLTQTLPRTGFAFRVGIANAKDVIILANIQSVTPVIR